MVQAVQRGGLVLVEITATIGDGTPRDLSNVSISVGARFDGSTVVNTGTVKIIDEANGKFVATFEVPSHRVGLLLLDAEYSEDGVINSSPTIEITVLDSPVERRVDRLRTQYRESPNLIHTIRSILNRVEEFSDMAEKYPDYFRLESAVGDQLTMIGRRLGWPRCHCICSDPPVFGFTCIGEDDDLVGFCAPNSSWANCNDFGIEDFCIIDDEIYRTFLKVRIYQTLGLFDLESLQSAIRLIWPNSWIPAARNQSITIAPMIADADLNDPLLQLWPRVLPVAVGIRIFYHFGNRPLFGFGEGWAGLSECNEASLPIHNTADWLCQTDPSPC